ncbi:hypothetical protein GUJ93_ZPchr0010g9422 [Zizania palustris]|uniref:AP180 N-terminal homology (ANTH) domain-containing protein n=1 Tax=Zizania palustris TaxID=103762 RepID=A0A8J5W9M9_ZIZPA|nr:hypothetical protein GUJ93_ZPchr0010g9422 [Zizania palustris]
MAAMQSWRKAYGALKDTTTVSLANTQLRFQEIVAATSIARPRADIATASMHFRAGLQSSQWILGDCSAWVRTYGMFLEERLECFKILKYDVEAERLSKQGQGPEKPEGAANNNYLVQYALALVSTFSVSCRILKAVLL